MDEKFEVVISGVSARIPDCDNISDFMEKIYNKAAMTGVNTAWVKGFEGVPYYSGTVKDWDRYDTYAFNINLAQAKCQIPAVPKLLEMAHEAIIDAGIHPKSLSGTNCGIYTLSSQGDFSPRLMRGNNRRTMTGSTTSYASARIAYCLNLNGHNVGLDGSNNSLFYFLRKAVEEIREGRIEACLVGSTDFIHEPLYSQDYMALDALAEDGECLPFDEKAHGMVRADGGVVFFLQEASKAKRWRAIPIGFDYKFLGNHSLNYVHHDTDQMIKMLKKFYADCKVDPTRVKYIEADGSGIKSLDETEMKVLAKVFTENRADELLVGSVASNVGRSETSSGLISLLKAVLTFEKGTIPPTRNHSTPNSKCPALSLGSIKVATEETELKGDLIGVNSFSLASDFAHGLIKRPPLKTTEEPSAEHHIYFLSSRTEEGLEKIMDRAAKVPLSRDFTDLLNGVFHEQLYGHFNRGVMVVSETEKTIIRKTGHADSSRKRPLWFSFSGMGSQKNGMGKALLRIPVFAEAIDKCDAVLTPKGIDIKHVLTSPDKTVFDDVIHSFVGITAVQIGLIHVLRSLGIEADKFVGHSLGEQACAYADGALTLEEAILSAWARGYASQEAARTGTLIPGLMAAVGLGYEDIKDRLPESIDAACHNSNSSCTISGPAEDVTAFVEKLKAEEIFAKEVNAGNIAYHSRYITQIGERLNKLLKEILKTPRERSEKWISTSVPRASWGEESAKLAGAEYFTNNLLSSVLFEEAFAEVPADAVILEVAPQSLLLPILKRAFPTSVTSLSLMGRISEEKPAFVHFLGSIGELYLLGYEPNPAGLYPPISYPVAASTPDLASFVTWEHSFHFDAKKFLLVPDEFELMSASQEKSMDMIMMQLREFRHLFEGHVLLSRPMIPLSYFLNEIWSLLAPKGRFKKNFDEITPHFTDILVHSSIWMDDLPEEATMVIQLSPASGSFEVCLAYREEKTLPLKGDVIVSGKAAIYEKDFEKERWCCEHPPTSSVRRTLNIQDLKNAYGAKGYDLSPEFQNNISELQIYDEVSVGKLTWKKNWQSVIDGVIKAGLLINVDSTEVSCPVAIQSLILKPDDIKLMDYGSEITFTLDRRQNVLVAAEGIEMKGLIFKAPPKRVSVSQTLECSEFLPYFTSNFQQEEEFLSAALEIMLNCCPSHKKETHKINICECGNLSRETGILSDLKRTVQKHYSAEISLSFNDKAAMKHDFRGLNLLVTSESGLKAGFIQHAEDLMSDFILCIAKNSKSLTVPGYAEVSRYVDPNQNGQYILLKQMCRAKRNIFKVVSKNLSDAIDGLKMPSKDVVITLIWEKQPTLNPHEIIEELKAKVNLSENMRLFFILDDDAPSFSERNPFYSEQLRLGFPVNILRNCTWCTYRKFHLQGANPELLPDIVDISKIKREDIDIHYISLNMQKQRIKNYEQDVYVLEYSGVTKDQKKVMGLAQYRPEISNMEINIDPKLIWEVPPGVSMEDAATFPLLCGMANYALIMCVTSYDVNSALVHNGSSLHGLTCIAVAFHAQLEVFTTVYSAEERNIVKRHFPQLEDSHIIDAWAEQFDLRLKLLTGGRGADLVVSDVPASRITAAWECVAPHGSFIDLNETNMTVNAPLPMFHFLKCTTYYSCLKTGLFSLADWRKQELWNLVQATLTAGVLVKVPRRVFGAHQLDVAARALNKESGQKKILLSMKIPPGNLPKNFSMNKSIYHCNSTDAYVILSPSIGKSLSLIEWILIRGGRKVVLVVSNQIGGTKKLNDLIDKYGAQLLISSIKKFNSGAETASLMDQIKKLRPVPILFNIYMDERLATHIASFLPNLHHIVNVARTQDSIQNKSGRGANTQKSTTRLCIICEDGESYLQLMDEALLSNSDPKNDSIYSINDCTENLKKQTIPLREYLPKSFEELEEIGKYAESFPKPLMTATDDSTVDSTDAVTVAVTDAPSDSNKNSPPDTESRPIDLPPCAAFEEIHTLARRQRYQREILPVYLISSSVKKFAPIQKKLLYPLYFAKFSEQMSSAAEAAKHLYNSICAIQPNGPCTIITESWNIPIAVDLIGKLKESHRQASLTILPISQKSLHSVVPREEELEDIILRNLLQSSLKEYQSLYSEMALETKVADIIGKVSLKSDKNLALAGLTIFKKQMQLFLETPLPNKLLDCPVLVVEMEANLVSQTDYAKISKGEVSVFRSSSTTYEELLADPTLIKELNSRQLFSWLHENETVSK